jgi:aromatic-L-amino-acid decarboxylase
VQLGRRFRALKLWMVIRSFGQAGLAERVRAHIQMAQEVAAWVDADPNFERLAPAPFSTVCFRARPQDLAERLRSAGADEIEQIEAHLDRLNEAIVAAINAGGEAFFSHTRLNGRYTIRMAIGNIRTSPAHVARAWELIRATAQQLDAELRPALETKRHASI